MQTALGEGKYIPYTKTPKMASSWLIADLGIFAPCCPETSIRVTLFRCLASKDQATALCQMHLYVVCSRYTAYSTWTNPGLAKTTEDLFMIRQADSVTIDPHKAAYVPYPAGALCYRDGRMRFLITWTSPYISRGATTATSIGVFGIEGR